jgi:hypothetical protein
MKPLHEALADLDSPEAVSDRNHRALEESKRLIDEERQNIFHRAGPVAVNVATVPLARVDRKPRLAAGPNAGAVLPGYEEAAGKMAGHNLDLLVQREVAALLRLDDERKIRNDPDRIEYDRVWSVYSALVNGQARLRSGIPGTDPMYPGKDGEGQLIAKVQHLVNEHCAAEDVGDSTRRMDKQLDDLGCPFPAMPAAAFASARLTLSGADLADELARLEAKYDYLEPTDEPTEAPKARRTRKVVAK